MVVYAGDPGEEGASVLVYDLDHDLLLSRQGLKLFGSPPILVLLDLSLFVPVGLNILVLGLKPKKARLAALLGRQRLESIDLFETREPWAEAWDHPERQQPAHPLPPGAEKEDWARLLASLEQSGETEGT